MSLNKKKIDSPKPVDQVEDEGNSGAFIPYAPIGENLEHVPIYVRPDLQYYVSRMAFFPNCNKLYLHVPWIAQHLFRLNNALMRDERNSLSEHFKYRLSLIMSRDNECPYCVAHHVAVLKRRWDYQEETLKEILHLDQPVDEKEKVAIDFVHQATLDPAGVSDELRDRLAKHFTPQEVMELILLIGFWKMYNTMHVAMKVPLEKPALPYEDWVHIQPGEKNSVKKEGRRLETTE